MDTQILNFPWPFLTSQREAISFNVLNTVSHSTTMQTKLKLNLCLFHRVCFIIVRVCIVVDCKCGSEFFVLLKSRKQMVIRNKIKELNSLKMRIYTLSLTLRTRSCSHSQRLHRFWWKSRVSVSLIKRWYHRRYSVIQLWTKNHPTWYDIYIF